MSAHPAQHPQRRALQRMANPRHLHRRREVLEAGSKSGLRSIPWITRSWSRRWKPTPMFRGWCCMSSGGCPRRWHCRTGPCDSATGAPRKGPRSRPQRNGQCRDGHPPCRCCGVVASLGVRSRIGMRWRMVIFSGPTRTSLTSSRRIRWRSGTVAVSASCAELGEEAVEVVGEFEVGLAVGGLGVEGLDLVAQVGFSGAEVGHPGAQLVDGDQLLGERGDHPGDRGGGLGQRGVEALRARRRPGRRCGRRRRRLSISAAISAGSAISAVMWSQTTWSR